MRLRECLLLLFFGYWNLSFGQELPTDSIPPANIEVVHHGSLTSFRADLPILEPIPGGRAPFYTYLWDFGDGHFSTEANPTHQYTRTGEFDVTLYAINNYNHGRRPRRPTKRVEIDSTKMVASITRPSPAEQHFFASNGIFQLSKNADAQPGEDMVVIAGINAPKGKGRIFLLTNEKLYKEDGFLYAGQSTYNQEQLILEPVQTDLKTMWASASSVTVTQSGSPDYGIKEEIQLSPEKAVSYFSELYDSYKSVTSYEVQESDDSQFSFINLDITPEMLADTNATVMITGIYLPENGNAIVHRLEVPIVTSHDPNKMSLRHSRMSYRTLSKRKKLTYKVQFQNDGEGDAKNVRLEIELPKILDPSTFKLLNLYPQCDTCLTPESMGCYQYYMKGEDTLVFHFKDIALPGTAAPDVTNLDSTKGFIRFSILPKKKLPNRSFRGRTNIFFDKNDPITTNFATGRFVKSFSPILFAGYHHSLKNPSEISDAYKGGGLFGLGLAPLAPYKKLYWQVELYASTYSSELEQLNIREPGQIELEVALATGVPRPQKFQYERFDRFTKKEYLQLKVVPLHLRYNFNSWVSAGLGVMAYTTLTTSHAQSERYYLFMNEQETPHDIDLEIAKAAASKFSFQPFADINVGRVYLGPAIGFRYFYDNRQGQQMNVYAAWRF